jgi:hypothetical protein
MYFWGAQLEAGAFMTSYIPNAGISGTTVTRNADVATMTGTNFSDWYNQTEGSFIVNVESAPVNNIVQQIMYVANAAGTQYMFTRRNAAGVVATAVANSGSVQADVPAGSAAASSVFKSAFAYKEDSFAAAINASAVTQDTSGTVADDINRMFLGANTSGGQSLNGRIRNLSYYPIRLTNAELQAFSK